MGAPSKEPSKPLVKLANRLFDTERDRADFMQALLHPPVFAPTILWTQPKPPEFSWEVLPPLPWQPAFVDRLAHTVRPGQHPLHDKGYFYCLDFSSVFAVSALLSIPEAIESVIDLCAAPGGKSLFTWVALKPKRLLCNEVVRKRVRILISNLKRCGAMDAIVLNQDPAVLVEQTPNCAQLVLVDAPCSGQSLLAKGQAVPGCFHKVTLNRNANRQKRILANAAQLVQSSGYLLYSTCTYAPEENEQVCAWFLKKFPQFVPVPMSPLSLHQSPLTELPCYRLWPHTDLGAGAFMMLLKRQDRDEVQPVNEVFLTQHQLVLYAETR
ncbi:RsmB/NOP family class I SAM-dependent RNA methyltransferase [Oscillatoria sp. CS-180]|uniref:RsmB/NOP family class I SAM-dependent RNA methyltransferase n=1 Tax=Oscillatoria sp. CS-180 TaxID=3021720 RepID=UPI00232BB4A6|nr:RsmB/NOP family class I SAM-dependent RNA methyltransferase [Oscillatoria sp. CS-180]MDB9525552.1 RsmB/NOP family class I SAM-dependent RNA methyltransferase [Oscillatoria sp. CS-180]